MCSGCLFCFEANLTECNSDFSKSSSFSIFLSHRSNFLFCQSSTSVMVDFLEKSVSSMWWAAVFSSWRHGVHAQPQQAPKTVLGECLRHVFLKHVTQTLFSELQQLHFSLQQPDSSIEQALVYISTSAIETGLHYLSFLASWKWEWSLYPCK